MIAAGNSESDADLLLRIRNGDSESLAVIYDCYGQSLFSLFVRVTHSQEAAQDLTQELFSRIWNRPQLFDPKEGTMKRRLFAMARVLALNHIREAVGFVTASNPIHELEHHDCACALHPAVLSTAQPIGLTKPDCRLSKREKFVLDLACFYGYSPAEIAELLQSPVKSVKAWMRSGMIHFRRQSSIEETKLCRITP